MPDPFYGYPAFQKVSELQLYEKTNIMSDKLESISKILYQSELPLSVTLAVNRKEAAAAISLSPASLDRLVAKGLIRPIRASRRPLFAIKELERFVAVNTTTAKSTGGNDL